jgi:hypothetical protein
LKKIILTAGCLGEELDYLDRDPDYLDEVPDHLEDRRDPTDRDYLEKEVRWTLIILKKRSQYEEEIPIDDDKCHSR